MASDRLTEEKKENIGSQTTTENEQHTNSTTVIMLSMRLYDIHITLVIRRLSIFNRDNNAFHRFILLIFVSIMFFSCVVSFFSVISWFVISQNMNFIRSIRLVGVHIAANVLECFLFSSANMYNSIKAYFQIMWFCNQQSNRKKIHQIQSS